MAFARRPRRCAIKSCRTQFMPISMTHKVCSADCSVEWARLEGVKKARKEARIASRKALEDKREHREKLDKLKTRQEWLKEAQIEFNRYIRERDSGYPCISCGSTNRPCWDAGHLRSVGAAPQLRFNEDNCHKQCIPCNQHLSGNVLAYRMGLVERIGEARVSALEVDNSPRRYSIDEARAIKALYRAKLKELKVKGQ